MKILSQGVCWALVPYLVTASLFYGRTVFSPSPLVTNVAGSNWTLRRSGGPLALQQGHHHRQQQQQEEVEVDVDADEDDEAILHSVVSSMREYSRLLHARRHGSRRKKRSEEVVCYKDLGCFRDTGAFDYLDILPSPPEEVDTRFMFYTRRGADKPFTHVYAEGKPLIVDTFNGSANTKIIIHGFGSGCGRHWAHDMRSALLKMFDCNVICVDWSKGAATPNYMRAAANTQLVGRQVAVVIKQLMNRYGSSVEQFHLIGFSLGAHVSGFTGNELNGTISRITGLDPAGPLFEGYPPLARLDPGDAKFVDVIHSNGDSLLRGGLGTYEELGHADFYPNGGRVQKGCTNLIIGAFSDLIWSSGPGGARSLCNHRRSYHFFIESISPACHFPAMPCDTYERLLSGDCFPCKAGQPCAKMGYYADRSTARGKLYLITRDGEPFCANQMKISISGADASTYGRVEITLIAGKTINETFPLTSGDGDEINRSINRILVAHPAIERVHQVQLTYVAYKGWVYSGTPHLSIDRVSLTDSYDNTVSHCGRNTVLRSGIPKLLTLSRGRCRISSLRPLSALWSQDGPSFEREENNRVLHCVKLQRRCGRRGLLQPRRQCRQSGNCRNRAPKESAECKHTGGRPSGRIRICRRVAAGTKRSPATATAATPAIITGPH